MRRQARRNGGPRLESLRQHLRPDKLARGTVMPRARKPMRCVMCERKYLAFANKTEAGVCSRTCEQERRHKTSRDAKWKVDYARSNNWETRPVVKSPGGNGRESQAGKGIGAFLAGILIAAGKGVQ